MAWLDDILEQLARDDRWGYRIGEAPAAEPTSLAALALIGHGRTEAATKLLDTLTQLQDRSGAVGIYQGTADPHWGTAHAVIAWSTAIESTWLAKPLRERLNAARIAACKFILSVYGQTIPLSNEVSHDTTIVGWPWVEGTHSWLEPTAVCYLALKAADMQLHPRALEAVRLMVDRLLPDGGCNYGNTFVLGQTLKPHIQPTGLVLVALADANVADPRFGKSLAWLADSVTDQATTASLAYALLGLAANGRERADAATLLEAALKKPTSSLGAYMPRRSLAALAVLGKRSPLITLGRQEAEK